MGQAPLHFENVTEGDEAPVKRHTLTRTDLVRYAGASGDYNPMHHDEILATAAGGTGSSCGFSGCGTVFELTPAASGLWTRKILYSFGENSKDGFEPFGSLIFDADGNLYGTTYGGGAVAQVCSNSSATGCGTVFELTPKAGGGWSDKVIHNFTNNGKDGFQPIAGLIFDAAGNLFGPTLGGGTYAKGTVFEIKR